MCKPAAASTVLVLGDFQVPPTFFGRTPVIRRAAFTWKPSKRCSVAGDRTHVLLPKRRTVLAAAGLHTIEHYVQVRRARTLLWVEERPILKLCREAEKRRGTTPHLYWWEQPMDLDKASAGAPADTTTEGVREDGGRAPLSLDKKPRF